MKYALELMNMGACRTFNEFWNALPLSMREKMNIHDAEFVFMARDNDIKQARLDGRKAALKELIHELDSTDRFEERDLVNAFYKTDISYEDRKA